MEDMRQKNNGPTVQVTFTDADQEPEEVFIREVSPEDVLEGKYVELLRTDPFALLEWICGKPEGWAKTLDRDSWTRLREAEERINFDFALAETKAAHERGQRLKFVDNAILETSEGLLRVMGSLSTSAGGASGGGVRDRRPAPPPKH